MTVKYSFYFIGLLVVFGACKNNEQEIEILNAVNNTLISSTNAIENANRTLYMSLEEDLSDPRTSGQAQIWQPKAIQVQTLSKDIFDYIEGLKTELREKAVSKDSLPFNSQFDKKNTNIVTIEFQRENKANELFEKLKKYRAAVLAVDSESNIRFSKTFPLPDFENENYSNFNNSYFKNVNAITAMTMLNKFQNNIRLAENNLVTFFNSKYSNDVVIMDYFPTLLIGQNTNHLRTGEKLQITAGIGAFSSEAKSHIIINGKTVETIDGRATYKIKVSDKIGKHNIPVKIEFTDQNGLRKIQTENVEYTVDE